ncbi:uncharacterized protein LOC113234380 [Hyposmocoma kahamanoa]|uniref:uncharacterized protein LOC113234380 n=1 Tax=Hyposmocoma kahamanoa TaxID=1477025 RepID=UPI000E6D6B7B|nr:uncharacterized protein LOC113234380 [Hyposmocoma kahamanoa]
MLFVIFQAIKEPADLIQAYVEATLMVSGLSKQSPEARNISRQLYQLLLKRAGPQHATAWLLANTMLGGLGLIKSENKDYKIRWHLPSCYSVLGDQIEAEYFPNALRDTLRFFIASKMATLAEDTRAEVQKHKSLIQ